VIVVNGAPLADVWVFDDFQPGSALSRVSIALDAERLDNWTAIYGRSRMSDRVPSGMLVAAMMEAYLKAVQPRPPGNIHMSQKLIFKSGANAGDQLDAEVSCIGKELRKERRWVTFGVTLRNGPRDVLRGEIRTIWAR
jgi:acyl dehydratase